jgi:hypothetical protein
MNPYLKAGKKILNRSYKNIKSAGWKNTEYIESAITGAMAGSAVGGVTEWAQGGSFTSGAMNGVVGGAMLGAGYKAAKVGATGSKWKNATASDVFGGYKNGVSKQVQAIQRLEYAQATGAGVYKGNGSRFRRMG